MLVHRGEHQERVSSWGLTRKGDATGCEGIVTSATRGKPVALCMDTAPLRERTCVRESPRVQAFLPWVDYRVKRILYHPGPCSALGISRNVCACVIGGRIALIFTHAYAPLWSATTSYTRLWTTPCLPARIVETISRGLEAYLGSDAISALAPPYKLWHLPLECSLKHEWRLGRNAWTPSSVSGRVGQHGPSYRRISLKTPYTGSWRRDV